MLRVHIGTTRFNNATYEENMKFRKENEIRGCIYGLPVQMPRAVKQGENVYVVEMNIESKKIAGIGLVHSSRWLDKYYRIYSDAGYNRYIYKGLFWLPVDHIPDKECLEILENVLFRGKGHMCRGHGITRLNPEKLKKDKEKVIAFLRTLFISQTPAS